MTWTYCWCPACNDQVPIGEADHDRIVFCPHCHAAYRVDVDAEWENGRWRDLTNLIPDPR